MKYKRVIIKIGTNVITNKSSLLCKRSMSRIVKQIAQLKKEGIEVVLVSSGAMGAGRPLLKLSKKTNRIIERQMLASVGQTRLMNAYDKLLSEHDYLCAQVLATKEDFRDRKHYLNMKNCLEGLLHDQIIPIINENDVVSVDELMFTDNDELAGLLSSMLNAAALILLTNVDGVMDNGKVISKVDFKKKDIYKCIVPTKSSFGRGGMITKCKIAEKMSQVGITTHIINGEKTGVISDILSGKSVGTKFIPKKEASGIKKWIAHSEGQEKGEVSIDDKAVEILTSPDVAASLLPVGITKISGSFEEDDIIKIKNQKGDAIGLGVAQYGSKKAEEFIGKKGKKPLVHYDYLFIF